MLPRRAAVERPCPPLKTNAGTCKAIREHRIPQRDNFHSARMEVAVHVANQMADTGRFGEVARINNYHLFIRGADDVGRLRVVMEQLPGVKDGARRQFERKDDAIRGFDEPPDAPAIDGAHRQFDNRQSSWWFPMRMENANRYRRRRWFWHLGS